MSVCKDSGNKKGCGAEIEWVKSKKDKNVPLNMEHVDINKIKKGVVWDEETETFGSVEWFKKMESEGPFRVSHFSTCPHAADFRKKKE